MTAADPVALTGAPGSPYTRKMLAVLRYRRIPYRFLPPDAPMLARLPQPKVRLMPTFYLPRLDGGLEAVVDSTPIIKRLEAEHAGRSLVPTDPAVAFLSDLIEDYADEWLTKAMFHYRWTYADDIAKAGLILASWRGLSIPDEALAERAQMFRQRQIVRLYVVGSNAVTGPVIEASYRRFLEVFEAHLRVHSFLLGARPGSADFAVFGQLTQLAHFDPTPASLTLQIAPRVHAWVSLMEDLSGLEPEEGDWFSADALPSTLTSLLAEIGRTYAPVMLANTEALSGGADQVQTHVDGRPWAQPPFRYQAKCLQWLRAAHADLPPSSRTRIDAILAPTGCLTLFG